MKLESNTPLKTIKGKSLTPMETKFIDEYISNGGNATQACLAAGYRTRSLYKKI